MWEKAKPTRTISLIRPPNSDGVGVFCIRIGKKMQFYTFCEIRCEIGGQGFGVHRLGQGNHYHVRVGKAENNSCECLGFLRWGACKHISGLTALIQQGQLNTPNCNSAVGGGYRGESLLGSKK